MQSNIFIPIVLDIEANGLKSPDKIWLIVCKELNKDVYEVFKEPTTNKEERDRFIAYVSDKSLIYHNGLSYDYPVLNRLLGLDIVDVHKRSIDTLIVGRMADFSRKTGHSLADYGEEIGLEKIKFTDFSHYTPEMLEYCIRDVQICEKVYKKYIKYINAYHEPIQREQRFQGRVNELERNGFYFDIPKATELLETVSSELDGLDREISTAFPPREVVIREFTPKATKYGTISLSSVPRSLRDRIHEFEIGKTYPQTKTEPFNPSSHKQLIQVLTESGWKPEERTKTHVETLRDINRLKYKRDKGPEVDKELQVLYDKAERLKETGWKINEKNLSSLPPGAPPPARMLAKRILLEARRRTLTEWLSLVDDDSRIRGRFQGIGAWTHRMAHQNPNTANIPSEFDEQGRVKLLGKEMRSLWCAPPGRKLIGVDAEGIQLRIFAHYIDDKEFTDALVQGRKADKSDPHSLNMRILGGVCKTRQAAKRFIYALLLGGGFERLASILEASEADTRRALDRLLERYTGFQYLKEHVIPADARRGWFSAIDGRPIPIPGDSVSERRHLCMSGYLQSGEAIVMKEAANRWEDRLLAEGYDEWLFVNLVHDEDQTEASGDEERNLYIASVQADAIKEAGEYFNLKCPLAGSYWNDDHKRYTIGDTWYYTH